MPVGACLFKKNDEILAKYDMPHQVIHLKVEYNEIVKYLNDVAAGIAMLRREVRSSITLRGVMY
jgi:hypothetical protein